MFWVLQCCVQLESTDNDLNDDDGDGSLNANGGSCNDNFKFCGDDDGSAE